jgi:hypothetical protein
MTCNICDGIAHFFAEGKILAKYSVSYFHCEKCGFVQTEEPYWLKEAYSDPINRCDVGLVSRNIDLSKKTTAIIRSFFNPDAKFVDYGGGYGLFVRMMRDVGFDFYRYDKHCENIFAKDFEAEVNGLGKFELISAFEVFEHLAHPLEEIEQMLGYSRNVLFTTELLPGTVPMPDSWRYYIPEYGQHISFYTLKTLSIIAEKFSLNLCSDGKFFHLLTAKRIPPYFFRMVSRKRIASIIATISCRKSLLSADYEKITGEKIS